MNDDTQRSAKVNRDRLFSERPTILDEEAKRAATVRQNMARLRELRLAKEAEVGAASDAPNAKSRKRQK